MADNIAVTPGLGATVAADEIAGALHQRVKITIGADGTNDGDVSSANPLPVSGTVTANLGATDNAVLDAIAASAASVDGKVTACNTGAVTVAASALPTGAATAAKQDTLDTSVNTLLKPASTLAAVTTVGTVTTITNAVAVTNAGITSIDGKVTACNTGAVVLAAGTAAIGKLAANSGVDIGDVDVASCALPTGASTSAKQDTIIGHVDGLETTLTAINNKLVTGTDIGDVTINNAGGAAAVNIQDGGNAITVDNGGTFAVQATLGAETTKVIGTVNVAASQTIAVTQATASSLKCEETSASAIKTSVELIDNAVYVDDADWTGDTSSHLLVGGVYEAVPQTVTSGDVAPISLNINGAVRVTNAGGALAIPNIDSYTHAVINLAAGNDQVLVSSAANKQIWVYGITFTVNVAGTVSFQDEDNTAITGIMPIDAKGGMAINPSGNFAMPIWKLATDKDLEVDVVTSEIDGFLTYAIVSV